MGSMTFDDIYSSTELVAAASEFLLGQIVANPNDQSYAQGCPSLYVAQGEIAYSFAANPLVLTTDDATTCCIIVLQSKDCFCLAHVDSRKQAAYVFTHWHSITQGVDTFVIVVGGYEDERNIGNDILQSILHSINTSTTKFTIKLWVAGPLNTIPGTSPVEPKVRGLVAVPLPTKSGFLRLAPIDFALGAYRGPNFERRANCLPSKPLLVLKDNVELVCTVGPYAKIWVDLKPVRLKVFLAKMQNWTDEELLSVSTSPSVEGPKFVPDMRDRIVWLSTKYNESDLLTVESYRWNAQSQEWELIMQ
ncbi:hypothetical protein THRCLA_22627 [Thraustotheca clavata]|uniref:Protein N-terminal asparagine amidohydrolase n=1 Tax=Thraustotheca clavata TaxID=74557 RepID=A0A1V9YW10_9STRA|nr:hypothetical protein THRCLA_22627 [Thraustotheca clavata]